MPNSTVPAADEGLPNINRRSALGKIGLGLASTASIAAASAVAAPQEIVVSPELRRLIDSHREASAGYEVTDQRCKAAMLRSSDGE